MVLGLPVLRAFAIGALALNSLAVFGPLLGIKTEPVEYDPSAPYVPMRKVPYRHPAMR